MLDAGGQLRLVQPAELRDRVLRICEEALARYAPGGEAVVRAVVKKLRRALFVLPYVAARGAAGVPLAEVARMFGMTPAQMAAEIRNLNNVGVPGGDISAFFDFAIEGRGPAARVTASPFRLLERPPRLTPQEAYALLLGAAALRRTGLPVFDQALARATEKIRALLRRRRRPRRPGCGEAVAIDAGRPVRDAGVRAAVAGQSRAPGGRAGLRLRVGPAAARRS